MSESELLAADETEVVIVDMDDVVAINEIDVETITLVDESLVVEDPSEALVIEEDDTELIEILELGPQGPRGGAGPPGPEGPQGLPGGGQVAFTYLQDVPNSIWIVDHDLGYRPGGITVEDSAGHAMRGVVTHLTDDQLKIEFIAPFAGRAYLS